MKRRSREKLPPIPSGNELLDMVWRDMTPNAVVIFEQLPAAVSDVWATVRGAREFWASVLRSELAKLEFAATPSHSTMARLRKRGAATLESRARYQAYCIAAALKQRIVADWPRASSEQVLLLIAERFRALSEQLADELAP